MFRYIQHKIEEYDCTPLVKIAIPRRTSMYSNRSFIKFNYFPNIQRKYRLFNTQAIIQQDNMFSSKIKQITSQD